MYQWLEENIQRYYTFVRVLKIKEKGDILLYKHTSLGNYVVVKKLNGYYPVYERLAGIRHENLPNVYEEGHNAYHTIVIEEYVRGMTVAEMLECFHLPVNMVRNIAIQICEGLSALHACQIIHRDIKPENVIVQNDGQIKIIDFDASRIYRQFERKDTRIIGTVGYAPPEQYGEAQSDARTDIYALGIMMNVMLTGVHPVNQMAQGKMKKIIEKCIRVNPNTRYRTVMEVKKKLKKV